MKHLSVITLWYLLLANTTFAYNRQDTLRGSNGPGRSWWDVERYDLTVKFDTANQTISGKNIFTVRVVDVPTDIMQIDMQEGMRITEVWYDGKRLQPKREGNVYWIQYDFHTWARGKQQELTVLFEGKPRKAVHPPWDGGLIWTKDSTGKPWIAVACQGLGASAWWPCKDYQGDEPDSGMTVNYTVPEGMRAIGNGKMIAESRRDNYYSFTWDVKNPINSYDISFYIGDYVNWTDTIHGELRPLGLDFYALRQNEAVAKQQFAVVKPMLHCFEYWMGPYPFYSDGYKLIEAPYLGMEHQSAIAYGNQYKMGYLGRDRSLTDIGMGFDYIIVHESGHEWFGNNITTVDAADGWVHEGFTTYSEMLFVECMWGKDKARAYVKGERNNIANDKPIQGAFGVNDDGSGDKYDKMSNIIQMIRMMMNDDEKFRQMLRGMNKEFYHKTITGKDVEDYIIKTSGLDLTAFFEQYLTTRDIPQLEWYIKKKQLYYRFNNVVKGFTLPVAIHTNKAEAVLHPTDEWMSIPWKRKGFNIEVSDDMLITVKY
ncbi:MAG: M1 family metallopeptidase [Bacteroidetes bacterium]|nr:M1 family metallopeptidase [Bacteroidota bacterium]